MKKSTKFLVCIGIVLLLIKLTPYFKFYFLGHKTDFSSQKNKLYFFKKEQRKQLDKFGSCTYTNSDIQSTFNYKGNSLNFDMGFLFTIWEFKELNNIDIFKIRIQNTFDLFDYKFDDGEIINAESELRQDIKYHYSFENGININVDNRDTIQYIYKGNNYFGCYGNFHSISIGNQIEKNQIVFHNDFDKPLTSIIFFKKRNRFFIISVESDRYFDPNIINILNIGKGNIFKYDDFKKKQS